MAAPTLPTTISITNDPAVDGLLLKGIVVVASAATPWLMSHLKLSDPSFAIYLTGALVSVLGGVATFVWGFVNSRVAQAKAVQAGVNLAVSGQAIMQPAWDGQSTPKPVTSSTAQAIIRDFGDVKVKVADEPALTDQLNQASKAQSAT